MILRMLVVAAICVLPICVSGAAVTAQRTTLSKKVESFCQAESSFEQFSAGIELFQQATIGELEKLKMDPHEGVAIRAAWEFVRRTVDETEKETPVRVNAESLHRFLGFVEGRLKISVPVSWQDTVLNARATRRAWIGFRRKEKHWPNLVGEFGLWVPKDTSIKQVGDDWLITVQGQSCRLPSRLSKHLRLRWRDGISALICGERCYLAVHWDHCSPYDLFCIERDSGKVLWKARPWANGGLHNGKLLLPMGSVMGPSVHSVAIMQQRDRVVLFGIGHLSAYIECFSTADGTNIFRCSTSY